MTDIPETVPLSRPIKTYVRDFAFWYIGISIFLAVLSHFFDVGTGVRVITPFFAALVIGEKFVKLEKRAPSRAECKTLTMKSFVVYLLFNLVIGSLLAVLTKITGKMPDISSVLMLILAVVAIVLSAIVYGMLYLAYGWVTSMRAKKLLAKR